MRARYPLCKARRTQPKDTPAHLRIVWYRQSWNKWSLRLLETILKKIRRILLKIVSNAHTEGLLSNESLF